ncbi:hypothetical protein AGOR_G00181730, partial [Albula goreensis]
VKEQCPGNAVSERQCTPPTSLLELCHLVQCRIQGHSVLQSISQEGQQELAAVLRSELGLVWHELKALSNDPSLTQEENKQLHNQIFSEVIRVCEEIYLHCLRLLETLRQRGIFSDQANLSRVRAQMAMDCSTHLNIHSIKRRLTMGIKTSRRDVLSSAKHSDEDRQQGAAETHAAFCYKLNSTLQPKSNSKKNEPHRQHEDTIVRDLQEINEKIEDLDLELVYDLMPCPMEQITYRGDTQFTAEEHSTEERKHDFVTTSPSHSRLKGYDSVPELQHETLLAELQVERSAARPQTPLVLQATGPRPSLDKPIDPAEDLRRLLLDSDPPESMRLEDPEADLPPLIRTVPRRSSTKLKLLQETLKRLEEEEELEKVVKKAVAAEPEHPQAAVVNVTFSPKSIARIAAARISDRVFTETINIPTYPPICNDLTGEIELSTVQWLDRNLYAGAEITEVYRELSKSVSTQHLNLDEDPMIEPALTDTSFTKSLSAKRKKPYLINKELKVQNPSKVTQRRMKNQTDHRRPEDETSREYSAWLQWWKSHLSLEDYLNYISTQELDYLGVVFHLYDSDDEENEKSSAPTHEQEENEKRKQRMDELKRKKQEFVTGVWNVNSVMLGGLGKEPILEGDNLNEDLPPDSKQEAERPEGGSQLQMRLEKIWRVLCFPDGMRQDMALKYSANAHRDQLEEAIVEWECIAQLIHQRENVLSQLEQFEKEASDPNRFFQHGYGGSSMARMEESRHREKLNSRISALDKDIHKALQEIKDRFHDTVTYRGRPYGVKMRWDRIEMLYWLQQERRMQAMEKAAAVPGTPPARLPPLESHQRMSGPTPHNGDTHLPGPAF